MTPEEIEACWKDPANYRWGVYFSKPDPRVVVPKRYRWMGWTLNFARPSAVPVLLGMIALLVVPSLLVKQYGGGPAGMLIVGAVGILSVCLLSAFLASPRRWGR